MFSSLPLLLLLSSVGATSVVLLLGGPCLLAFPPFCRFALLVVFFHAAIDHFKLALDASGSVSLLASLVFLSYDIRHFFLLLLFGLFVDAIWIEKQRIDYKVWWENWDQVAFILTILLEEAEITNINRCSTSKLQVQRHSG